ncbi:hypothetical protein EPN96_07185 [bacterium]|nr:MAG: hypothetical protein EPN96_07185 [bacterium]
MYNLLGLRGDPFAGGFDPRLYRETAGRKALLEEGANHLRERKNIWIRGQEGSGRGWFIQKLLGAAADATTPLLFAKGELPGETLPFFASLYYSASFEKVSGDLPSTAEKLYTKLLRRFWQGGTVIVVPGTSPLRGEGALREVSHLASARIKGAPLCCFVLCGEGSSPFTDFKEIPLSPFSPEELYNCLRHRLETFGNREAIPGPALEAICEEAKGVGRSMELASACLGRLLFDRREPRREEAAVGPQKEVLPQEQVAEISRLLSAISS